MKQQMENVRSKNRTKADMEMLPDCKRITGSSISGSAEACVPMCRLSAQAVGRKRQGDAPGLDRRARKRTAETQTSSARRRSLPEEWIPASKRVRQLNDVDSGSV